MDLLDIALLCKGKPAVPRRGSKDVPLSDEQLNAREFSRIIVESIDAFIADIKKALKAYDIVDGLDDEETARPAKRAKRTPMSVLTETCATFERDCATLKSRNEKLENYNKELETLNTALETRNKELTEAAAQVTIRRESRARVRPARVFCVCPAHVRPARPAPGCSASGMILPRFRANSHRGEPPRPPPPEGSAAALFRPALAPTGSLTKPSSNADLAIPPACATGQHEHHHS
jgi:indole-3-glycerol phosphate synthase